MNIKDKQKVFSGCFHITKSDIRCLVANKASKGVILGFLVIVRCRCEYGQSSAGYTVLRKKLGIGTDKAKGILDILQSIQYDGRVLLSNIPIARLEYTDYQFDSYQEYNDYLVKEEIRSKYKRKVARWGFHQRSDVGAWFSNEMIDEIISFRRKNITYLNIIRKVLSDDALKLLLLLHFSNNARYDLVKPLLYFDHKSELLFQDKNVDFYRSERNPEPFVSDFYMNELWGTQKDNDQGRTTIIKLLNELEECRLVKRVVTVILFEGGQGKVPTGYYELDIKTTKYHEKRTHRNLSGGEFCY